MCTFVWKNHIGTPPYRTADGLALTTARFVSNILWAILIVILSLIHDQSYSRILRITFYEGTEWEVQRSENLLWIFKVKFRNHANVPELFIIHYDVISIGHFFNEFQYIKSMQATFDCYEIIIIEKKIEWFLAFVLS